MAEVAVGMETTPKLEGQAVSRGGGPGLVSAEDGRRWCPSSALTMPPGPALIHGCLSPGPRFIPVAHKITPCIDSVSRRGDNSHSSEP